MSCKPAPFSHDPNPTKIREECDYTQRWTLSELRSGIRPTRPIRIYTEGVFDLFHHGHVNMFRQLKMDVLPEWCEVYVLAGVSRDEDCCKYKKVPSWSEEERRERIRHCRYVNEVVPEALWRTTPAFISEHKIDFVSHDANPYVEGNDGDGDVYAWLKKKDMFIETKRTSGISTSYLRTYLPDKKSNINGTI